jgi:glycosyltransferase involved in cell wall biosynthesis
MKNEDIVFTVFTPTYNRAELINRVFTSLSNQDYRKFEWLIIDDGSNDNTEDVVATFSELADFDIRYHKKNNNGKVAAINDALDLAKGEFFLVFDSDDWCTSDALSRFEHIWQGIKEDEKHDYCAISCLKSYKDGRIVGEKYTQYLSRLESYSDRFNLSIKGDKWECIRTNIHKENKYDLYMNERYQAPEYAWLKMSQNYKTVFVDEVLSIVEYQADGISNNNLYHRKNSPVSAMSFYLLAMSVSNNLLSRCRSYLNYLRFCAYKEKSLKSKICNPVGSLLVIIDLIMK